VQFRVGKGENAHMSSTVNEGSGTRKKRGKENRKDETKEERAVKKTRGGEQNRSSLSPTKKKKVVDLRSGTRKQTTRRKWELHSQHTGS